MSCVLKNILSLPDRFPQEVWQTFHGGLKLVKAKRLKLPRCGTYQNFVQSLVNPKGPSCADNLFGLTDCKFGNGSSLLYALCAKETIEKFLFMRGERPLFLLPPQFQLRADSYE